MERLADILAIILTLTTLGISFWFRDRLRMVERIILWLFCIIYLTIFIYSALELANPEWLKYANRSAIALALIDLIMRVRRRKEL